MKERREKDTPASPSLGVILKFRTCDEFCLDIRCPITYGAVLTYGLEVLLTYGLEVLIPSGGPLAQLDKFMKRTLKQIMSLPVNTPDPVRYVLSGILLMEAQIHIQTLIMYNSICLQDDSVVFYDEALYLTVYDFSKQ